MLGLEDHLIELSEEQPQIIKTNNNESGFASPRSKMHIFWGGTIRRRQLFKMHVKNEKSARKYQNQTHY